MLTKENVLKILKECYDPEIPVNIVDLGLIYDVKVNNGNVHVKMTLTAPGCPMSAFITEDVKEKILSLKGVKKADVDVVFDPPWTPDRMSKTAKKQLRI
jgi:FeS assembly SUF system protein